MTIGYEGVTLQAFLAALTGLQVDTVVDVRQFPLSPKKGFSKSKLEAALARTEIAYRHERSLGCPPEIRTRLKRTGDYARYFAAFNRYLVTKADRVHIDIETDDIPAEVTRLEKLG
jgi:uncharacterized protein (DUF488 family)